MIDRIKIRCIGTLPSVGRCRSTKVQKYWLLRAMCGKKARLHLYQGFCLFHLIPSGYKYNVCIKGVVSHPTIIKRRVQITPLITMLVCYETINELKVFLRNQSKLTANTSIWVWGKHCDTTRKQIINGLRAYQSDNFTGLKMDNVFNGKTATDIFFKIYDKGLQTAKPTNLLRVEDML
jgi:hypothetical protein